MFYKMVLLFVYGTLQKGMWNNYLMASSKFIGPAKTEKKYVIMVFNDVIPKLYFDENLQKRSYQIQGELYDVSEEDLLTLDYHEGSGYERMQIPVILEKTQKDEKDEKDETLQTFVYMGKNCTMFSAKYQVKIPRLDSYIKHVLSLNNELIHKIDTNNFSRNYDEFLLRNC